MIKFVLENFDTIFKSKDSLENLDKLILDLAIKGKLVEQNPNDEPASELLKRIKEEKQRLIDEKIIKKEKPLPPIEEDEKPFKIPSNWEWVRLGEICNYGSNISVKPENIMENEWVLELEDIEKETSKIIQIKYNLERISKSNKNRFFKGDVLYGKLRPYLKKILVAPNDGVCSSEIVPIRTFLKLNSKFLVYILKSSYFSERINSLTYGTKMPRAGTNDMINSLIPLLPIEEQKRIVEKVEKLQQLTKKLKEIYISNEDNRQLLKKSVLLEIENSGNDKELLKNLEIVFSNFDKIVKTKEDIKDIRNLILSLAIKGKLVEQNPNDEPASELLKRIKKEKQRLIDEKIIKKEKPLPPIEEDEKLIEIPSNWEWVRLGEIGNIFNGNSINEKIKKEKYEDILQGLDYIATKDVEYPTGNINYNNGVKIPFEELNKFKIAHKNSILICSEGGSAGKKIGVTLKDICFGNKLYATEIYLKELNNKYVYYVYKTSYFYCNFKNNETGIIGGVSINKFKNIIIPIPPVEEQKRIVEKVENLMKICDLLESKLILNEKISENLLKSINNN